MLNLVFSVIALSLLGISIWQDKQQPTPSESPIFCNQNALTKEQRQRQAQRARRSEALSQARIGGFVIQYAAVSTIARIRSSVCGNVYSSTPGV